MNIYLVRDGDRAVTLATEHNNRIYAYVPNFEAFIYDDPLSADYLIDRELDYEPIGPADAAAIAKAGKIGRLDGRIFKDLLDELRAEKRRLTLSEVTGAAVAIAPEPTRTQAAKAKADQLRRAEPGQWIAYKTYPAGTAKQTALQLASDLRKERVRAFADIPLQSRVATSADGRLVVQVARDDAPDR